MNRSSEGRIFQRRKAASAANIRLVLPAALIRSALFVPGAVVFVREVAGFKSSVFCATGVFDGELLYKPNKFVSRWLSN